MTSVEPFDPAEPIAEGRSVIDASAGTGKTFTIAAQVTRLVAEAGIPIERILVVTFTRAATAELRDRIRDRLLRTLGVLSGDRDPAGIDGHIRVLLDHDADARRLSIERLREAVIRFDRAQIFTIHGFSIQLLANLGFHARISPDLKPIAIDTDIISQVVSDLIVQRFADDATDLIGADALGVIARVVAAIPDAGIVPEPGDVDGETRARAELAVAVRGEINRRLRDGGSAGYDHFLIEARDTLTDPRIGKQARQMLSDRYAVALVDESQDTDPIQWDVINAVFHDTRLVIIGDPKQSIYAFRGADIESYLSSVELAETRRTLLTNWRSDGRLITALDALFAGTTFGDSRIEYQKVEPALEHEGTRIHGPGTPLTIRRFDADMPVERRTTGSRAFKTPKTRDAVAIDVAAEIVRILTAGIEIDDQEMGRRPVGPADIAVLCNTHRQIGLVRKELMLRDVPSIAARSGSVFSSQAAEEWRRFLLGVEHPGRPSTVRYAASGVIVGIELTEVAALGDTETVELQAQMRRWNELLATDGVAALVADISHHTRLVERILRRPDGERLMTDLTHVVEAMSFAWRQKQLGSMLGWLEDAIRDAGKERSLDEAEARERRLETDAAAVQVRTIHGAKGLEYPIVLVPFLWDKGQRRKSAVPVFHGPDDIDGRRQRFVDVGGPRSPDFVAHQNQALAEDDAQKSRLLYVALTRAQHRLVVWWIDEAADTDATRLHEILTRGVAEEDDPSALSWLTEAGEGTIDVRTVTSIPQVERYEQPTVSRPELAVAVFDRELDYLWKRASFSSLSPGHPITATRDTDDEPLREDETVSPEHGGPPITDTPMPMAALPGGTAFGTLVHSILEHVPFDVDDIDVVVRTEVESALRFSSWALDLDSMVDGLVAAIHTPLGPDRGAPRLRDIPASQTLDEMGFEFPVRATGTAMTLGDIATTMKRCLPADDPVRGYVGLLDDLPDARFRGYLTGFIDLTAVVPDPDGTDCYVVMDYKTNTLTKRGEVPAVTDYAIGPMRRVMEDSHYLLQSVLYQVALHRYLQWRLPNYDPERHLGGSCYLFVRGMIGPDTPIIDGERCGVFRWRPPPQMIVELSRSFASEDSI